MPRATASNTRIICHITRYTKICSRTPVCTPNRFVKVAVSARNCECIYLGNLGAILSPDYLDTFLLSAERSKNCIWSSERCAASLVSQLITLSPAHSSGSFWLRLSRCTFGPTFRNRSKCTFFIMHQGRLQGLAYDLVCSAGAAAQ